jgi:hypothetical protein
MIAEHIGIIPRSNQLGIVETGLDRPVANRVQWDSITASPALRHGVMPLHLVAERPLAQPATLHRVSLILPKEH